MVRHIFVREFDTISRKPARPASKSAGFVQDYRHRVHITMNTQPPNAILSCFHNLTFCGEKCFKQSGLTVVARRAFCQLPNCACPTGKRIFRLALAL